MSGTSLVAKIILRLQDDASRGLADTRQHVSDIGREMNRVKQIALGWLTFEALKSGIGNLTGLSDKFAGLTARIKLATSSEQEFNTAQGELFNIAQRTRSALDTVVGLYAKVQIGVKALGGTQKQAFDTTEAVTQAFKISGASASESAGGIQQLTQALASGVLRGEEFNSIMENGSRVAQALADGLGVPVAALLGMAEAGELTAERVINALLSQKDKLAAEYATLPKTVQGAWQQLENRFLKYIGNSKDASEATRDIADSIGYVTDHLDSLITLAVKAGEVLLVAFGVNKLKALITYTEGLFAARAATIAATEAAAIAAATASAEAVAIATATAAREAEIIATQEVIVLARGEALAKLAATNATIAQTRATIAALEATVQTTSTTWLLTQATASLTAAETARAAILTDLAALSASNARMNAELAAAQQVQAAATVAQGEAAAAAATVPVTLFAKAIKAISWAVPLVVAAEVGVAIGEWARQFEWVQVAGANAAKNIAKIVAFGEALMHPSFENWAKFWAELDKINASFEETRAAIGRVDSTPAPTIFDKLKTSANSMAEGIDAALTKTKDAAKSHAEEMVKPYDAAAKAITTVFDAQSTQIDADLKNRLYAIDYLATSERQKIQETTQTVVAAEFEKITAALNTKIQLDQTWNETYGKAIELARQAGADVTALEKQGADDRIGSLQSVVNAYQSSVDNMIGEEQRLLDAIRHTAEERANLSRSVEDKIRALQQKGMTDVQAYADQQKQIDEKQAAAKKAILEGNFTDAKKYAEEAIRLAESSAHAVDNVSKDARGKTQRKEAISENQAVAKSIGQIKESAALADQALSGLGKAQTTQAANIASSLKGAQSGLAEFKGELDKAIADANSKAQLKISVDAQSAQAEINKLAALTAAKELTVKIKADPINADQEIADLQAKLAEAKITVPAVVAFDKMRDEELGTMRAFIEAGLKNVPISVDPSNALADLKKFKANIVAELSAPTKADHHVEPDFDTIYAAISNIKQNTSSTHTVYVNKVENNAAGGLIQHLATGGRVMAQTFRRVVGAIKGPGSGTSDDVPVMASNGEFVVKTEAVQHYGVNFMNALNNKQLPVAPGYAIGGAIGETGASAGVSPSSPAPAGETMTLVFKFDNKSIPGQFAPGNARALAVELRRLASVS
jgi:tape measure domain-containing protein